jgi:hypothetical protein
MVQVVVAEEVGALLVAQLVVEDLVVLVQVVQQYLRTQILLQ